MKSDSLYRLIHSLDKGESRFSRDYISSEKAKSSAFKLFLFDAIKNNAKYYNEQKFITEADYDFKGNLAVEKSRLFNQIVAAVKTLHDSRTAANNPYKKLEEARVLHSLALLDEAEEAIIKGLNCAIEIEDLFAEIQLRELLRLIFKNRNNRTITSKQTQNEYLLEMAGRKLVTSIKYTTINDRAFDYLRSYRVSNENEAKQGMEELINLSEMQDINMANSLPSQLRFYNTWNFYHTSKNEFEKSVEALFKTLSLWESNKARIDLYPKAYITVLSNILGKLSTLGRTDEAMTYLSKLEDLKVSSRSAMISKFSTLELQWLLFHLNDGNLSQALAREDKINTGLSRFKNGISATSSISLLYNLGVAHLISDNFGKALFYFNRVRNLGVLPKRADMQGVSRLLRLLILAEQEDTVHFSHYLRNSKPFFKKKDRFSKLEKIVYGWLKTHHKIEDQVLRKSSLKTFSAKIYPLVEQGMLGAEEIYIWALAKANAQSAREIFQQRIAK